MKEVIEKSNGKVLNRTLSSSSDEVKSTVVISPPNIQTAVFNIIGTAPLVINKFSQKSREQMKEKQEQGSQAKKGKARAAKDFDACYKGAFHVSLDGWNGIPASSFRCAMISACRLVNFKMTISKLSVFIIGDGFDADEGTPLVKIYGEPRKLEMYARNETGVCDIRIRPQWINWKCKLQVKFDADQFSQADIANLLMRAGSQVGVGEGRPDSKKSAGMGWGTFEIEGGKK